MESHVPVFHIQGAPSLQSRNLLQVMQGSLDPYDFSIRVLICSHFLVFQVVPGSREGRDLGNSAKVLNKISITQEIGIVNSRKRKRKVRVVLSSPATQLSFVAGV